MRPALTVITLVCAAVSAYAWAGHFRGAEAFPDASVLFPHIAAAVLAALAATRLMTPSGFATRTTLAVFFLVISLLLPVAGILAAGAAAVVLSIPSRGGLRAEDGYVFGNPDAIAARREPAATPPELRPLTEAFRTMDAAGLSRLALGLRGLRPVAAASCFLRRLQHDPEARVQFAAAAVMDTAVDTLEARLKALEQRPDTPANRRARALTLTELAGWPPPGDPAIAVSLRQAAELTHASPE